MRLKPVHLTKYVLGTSIKSVNKNFLPLQPAKCLVGDEAPSSETEDVIKCCPARAVVHLRVGVGGDAVIAQYRARVEYYSATETQRNSEETSTSTVTCPRFPDE
jgi:hypothetical protein